MCAYRDELVVKVSKLESEFKAIPAWIRKLFKYMRNAIVNAIVYGDSFQEQITKWYKDFQTAMADGLLNASEKTALNEEWNKIVKDGQDQVKAAEEAAGLNTSSSSDLSSLQQGIQSITETQASALEAIMNM